MTVRVYSADCLIEEVRCRSEQQACRSEQQVQAVSAYWQDNGFKVRISD